MINDKITSCENVTMKWLLFFFASAFFAPFPYGRIVYENPTTFIMELFQVLYLFMTSESTVLHKSKSHLKSSMHSSSYLDICREDKDASMYMLNTFYNTFVIKNTPAQIFLF